ncbi:MAG: hypothetical protein BWK80_57000 [Desulfobacteraceae bacterium IS3]|nr:MAG: hypothetical protein BWK80_57000 [Desulfobacteraceae bacterium IS3]
MKPALFAKSYKFAFKDRSFHIVKRFFKPLEKRFYGDRSFHIVKRFFKPLEKRFYGDRSFQTVQRFSKSLKPLEKRFYRNTVFDSELVSDCTHLYTFCRHKLCIPGILSFQAWCGHKMSTLHFDRDRKSAIYDGCGYICLISHIKISFISSSLHFL